jgi:ADP-ribose pyrophosphatase YjhB (NUDIX family)
MTYLLTISDEDVFLKPVFAKPSVFQQRITVKAIVRNSEGKIALVTNDAHGIYLLPGGGAESGDLENEIKRECEEEIGYTVELEGTVGQTREFRSRAAKEYTTTCFIAETQGLLKKDIRTRDERDNGLRVEWIEPGAATRIFSKQTEAVQKGEIKFYNTAFSILRDELFLETYLSGRESD